MDTTGMTRRGFGAALGAAAGAALLDTRLTPRAAEARVRSGLPKDVLQLNSNENPYGPSPAAREAMKVDSPFAQAPTEREGDGDPDDEEEGREDEVRDRHAVEVGGPVQERRGRPGDAGDLVHEQHEEDVGATEKVDRQDARGAGGVRGDGHWCAHEGSPGMSREE